MMLMLAQPFDDAVVVRIGERQHIASAAGRFPSLFPFGIHNQHWSVGSVTSQGEGAQEGDSLNDLFGFEGHIKSNRQKNGEGHTEKTRMRNETHGTTDETGDLLVMIFGG